MPKGSPYTGKTISSYGAKAESVGKRCFGEFRGRIRVCQSKLEKLERKEEPIVLSFEE